MFYVWFIPLLLNNLFCAYTCYIKNNHAFFDNKNYIATKLVCLYEYSFFIAFLFSDDMKFYQIQIPEKLYER